MKGQVFTGLKDAKGRKLYNGDKIYYRYEDRIEKRGIGKIHGTVVFENGAFVVKEESYKHYDWNKESTRPDLLWGWLQNGSCYRIPIPRKQKI